MPQRHKNGAGAIKVSPAPNQEVLAQSKPLQEQDEGVVVAAPIADYEMAPQKKMSTDNKPRKNEIELANRSARGPFVAFKVSFSYLALFDLKLKELRYAFYLLARNGLF